MSNLGLKSLNCASYALNDTIPYLFESSPDSSQKKHSASRGNKISGFSPKNFLVSVVKIPYKVCRIVALTLLIATIIAIALTVFAIVMIGIFSAYVISKIYSFSCFLISFISHPKESLNNMSFRQDFNYMRNNDETPTYEDPFWDDVPKTSTSHYTGTNLILENIANDIDEETLELIKEMDAEIFQFIGAKAVYALTLGEKRDLGDCSFLTANTQDDVIKLRLKYQKMNISEEILNALKTVFRSSKAFGDNEISKEALPFLIEFKMAGSQELRSSFCKDDYYAACKELNTPTR